MWGPQKDVPGECNAHLHIADDHGDNHATMRCQLEPGHDGPHREAYRAYVGEGNAGGEVVVTWEKSEEDWEAEMRKQEEDWSWEEHQEWLESQED